MNTTQLECFLAVANFLNFSRAAEQLRITQPAVSHQITTLEDELGVKLFRRTSKSVRLTQEGFQFTQYASEILKLSELSKARMKKFRTEEITRVAIGCRNTTELRVLRPALERLRTEQPRLLPALRLIPFDAVKNLLADGDIDMIFSFRGPGRGTGEEAKQKFRTLTQCRAVCVCSDTHPLAGRQSLTVGELAGAGRIAVCRPPICPPALFAVQTRVVGSRSPEQVLFCDNQDVVGTLVETGYAFAVMADFPSARREGLCYIPLPEFEPLTFGALYMAGNRNPALKEFLTLLEQTLSHPDPAHTTDGMGIL